MQSALLHPALSHDMDAILTRLQQEDAGMPDPTMLPPDQAREIAELTNRRWNRDLQPMHQIDDVTFVAPEGHIIQARLFTPPGAMPGLVIFIHGGGFALCSVDTHERAVRTLAMESKCAVLSVAYRLAPEYPFPAGLNDCIAAYRQLDKLRKKFHWTCGPTAICGDSAGANLALALMLHEQKNSMALPDFAMLFYGVYDADFQSESYLEYENGPGLTREKMMRYFDWYAPKGNRDDPLVCPLLASDTALKALPPLYLNAAEVDPLCSDTKNLAARLAAVGRKDQLRIYQGVVHGFMQMTSSLPAAREATAEAGNAFRQYVETTKIPKTKGEER
ncbi:MAG: alpha/beta hydrolase [Paracoccaceae bacterium]